MVHGVRLAAAAAAVRSGEAHTITGLRVFFEE